MLTVAALLQGYTPVPGLTGAARTAWSADQRLRLHSGRRLRRLSTYL